MKIPIYITVIILVAAAGAAWYQQSQIADIRADQARLVAKAAERGIAFDPKRPSKRDRERYNRIVEVRQTTSDVVDFHAKYTISNLIPGSEEEQDAYKEWKEITKPFASYDASQVKMAISTLLDSNRIAEDRRNGVIYTLIMHLKERDPQSALEMLVAKPEIFSDVHHRESTITDTFSILARKDLNRMIDWLKVNETKMPTDVSESCKLSVISIAAQSDPRRAFDLIRELEVKTPDSAITDIAYSTKGAGPRAAALGVIREYLTTISNDFERRQMRHQSIGTLINMAAAEGLEKGTRWIADAGLSAEELESLPQSFEIPDRSTESGKWIEWFAETAHGGETEKRIRYLVSKWTTQDHRAAGEWLATAPESPAKAISIQAYAVAVSKYEPETAAKWAMTLPPGNERNNTLKSIHQNWSKDDIEGAAAFAKEHGIK